MGKLSRLARRWWPVAIVGAVVIMLVGALWCFLKPATPPDRIAFVNLVVVALTGLVVIWYTWETRQLRRATLRQTDLQIRPFLSLEYEPINRKLWLRNLGRGVARDIVVHDVRLSKTAKPNESSITVEWGPVDFIAEGEARELVSTGQLITPDGKQEISRMLRAYMSNFGKHGSAEYEFLIDYTDLTGQRYRAVFEVVQGKTFLLSDDLTREDPRT